MQHAGALVLALIMTASSATDVRAQAASATLNANLAQFAGLTLSATTITFPDADPDTTPSLAPLSGPVSITAKARAQAGVTVTLTVKASDDLRSGVTVLPASYITWTATGSGFVGGTLDPVVARTVAAWNGSGIRSGTQSFLFQNLWSHPSGTYTVTLLYTLTAP
jgi:hypothetical protein